MKVLAVFPRSLVVALLGIVQCAAAEPVINAYLYNPSTSQIVLQYPYNKPDETISLKPKLTLWANSFTAGKYRLAYSIEGRGKPMYSGESAVEVRHGRFDFEIELKNKFPAAERVSWRLVGPEGEAHHGRSPLAWSRFHGRVRYKKGGWHSTYIDLVPVRWGVPGIIQVPVANDGTFDALVPARIYAVVNVNGTGYQYDAMERWAWNYDLRHDREDLFTIGTTEIYGARAFEIVGGTNTLFVFFRPSSLGRIHRFDSDADGRLSAAENRAMWAALKDSPTAIGPELTPDDIKIWVDGKPLQIAHLDLIPEADGDGRWQVDYLVQCFIPAEAEKVKSGVWHREIKIEVTSQEMLRGQRVTDFGEGSVDFLLE